MSNKIANKISPKKLKSLQIKSTRLYVKTDDAIKKALQLAEDLDCHISDNFPKNNRVNIKDLERVYNHLEKASSIMYALGLGSDAMADFGELKSFMNKVNKKNKS